MSDFRLRAKRYHEAIKKILLHDWDPIGVSDIPEAQDEYDSYVPGVYQRLISRAKENEIFDYLWRIETEHMGLYGNRRQTEAVAIKLLQVVNKIEGGEAV